MPGFSCKTADLLDGDRCVTGGVRQEAKKWRPPCQRSPQRPWNGRLPCEDTRCPEFFRTARHSTPRPRENVCAFNYLLQTWSWITESRGAFANLWLSKNCHDLRGVPESPREALAGVEKALLESGSPAAPSSFSCERRTLSRGPRSAERARGIRVDSLGDPRRKARDPFWFYCVLTCGKHARTLG